MRRVNNQDAVAVQVTDEAETWAARGHLLMVADGMGAHAAGELASKLAVDNIPHMYFKRRDLYPPAALRQAIRDANVAIHAKGQSSLGFQGMGTTCSCLVLLPQGALVAHIGDSRVYRLHEEVLEQLTFDHSLVWEMAAAGHMAEEDVPACIPKNVITRSLGPHPNVNVDLEGPYPAAEGDVFLVCSDGLSGQLSDEEIGTILLSLPPEEAVCALVDLANLRGGPDNISVVVAQVLGDGVPEGAVASDVREGNGENDPCHRRRALIQRALAWLAAAASLGILGYGLLYGEWLLAVPASVALVASLVAALVSRGPSSARSRLARSLGGPYGNGPYRQARCEPSRQVTDALAELAGKVRALAETEAADGSMDWQPFEEGCEAAATAARSGDFAAAVCGYCRAIRAVMQQFGDHPRPA